MEDDISTKRGGRLKQVGGTMVSVFAASLLIARLIFRVFLPDMHAPGMTVATIAVFVPIFLLGFGGALLWLVGFIRGRFANGVQRGTT